MLKQASDDDILEWTIDDNIEEDHDNHNEYNKLLQENKQLKQIIKLMRIEMEKVSAGRMRQNNKLNSDLLYLSNRVQAELRLCKERLSKCTCALNSIESNTYNTISNSTIQKAHKINKKNTPNSSNGFGSMNSGNNAVTGTATASSTSKGKIRNYALG